MYLGEVRCTNKNTSNRVSGPPVPKEPDTLPQRVACPPVPPINNRFVYDGPLLAKYKITDDGYYSSTTTGSVFENMLGYIPGGMFDAIRVWQTPKFSGAREIHERLRKEYRQVSGGHSGYTFHTLTYHEMKTIHNCLFS
ncbi:MAG: hypothetical protein CBD51_005365 [Flavobacteriales bacterium TMED191]|nr:MAG: hypothetical protein CBD51_005365 [Flavobacteriales bacterium TMED191]